MAVFLVPADSGEKITLAVSAMLTLVVFLMSVTASLPPTKDIPLISKLKVLIFSNGCIFGAS